MEVILNIFSPDRRLRHLNLWLVAGFVWIIGVNYWSLTSVLWVRMPGHTDKIFHAAGYCFLMLWWLQLFPARSARIILVLFFIAMGIGLEVLQSFNPMRHMDYGDMVANSTGVVIAFLMGLTRMDQLLYRVERKMLKNQ
ncbi:MAG: VanZ family protein [Gammaproteobacteria bacterium]|nr:VanZ family protein [Gammaproteobacteria bacterium]